MEGMEGGGFFTGWFLPVKIWDFGLTPPPSHPLHKLTEELKMQSWITSVWVVCLLDCNSARGIFVNNGMGKVFAGGSWESNTGLAESPL